MSISPVSMYCNTNNKVNFKANFVKNDILEEFVKSSSYSDRPHILKLFKTIDSENPRCKT